MLRINSTLLTKLFTSPDPQPENPDILKIYNSLGTRIFPGKDDIILFLQSQSHDKQLELAEKIIHRLCFVSNFPPPYYAINDIISVEEYQKISVGEQDSYVPRDHFIHTLNLYLLGIYVFFYNSEFYRKISSNTRFERRNEIHNHPKIDSIKDFISEWKYFCLYHDIGYAPEIFGSKKFVQDSKKVYEELCNSKNIFFASLMRENTTKQIAFFSAIEIMSRCFVWKTIMNYSNERIPAKSKLLTTFKTKPLSYFCNGQINRVNLNSFDLESLFPNCIKLEKIFSNKCLKPIIPIINENRIMIIGTRKDNGEAAFFSTIYDKKRVTFFLDKYEDSNDVKKLCDDPSLVLFDDYTPVEHELEYLVTTDDNHNSLFSNLLFDEDTFDYAFNYYCRNEKQFDICLCQ